MNGSCLLYYICLFIPCQPLVFIFSQKRSPPKWAWWFLLRGISYPRQCLDCQCSFHLTAAELDAQTVDGYFAFGICFCIYFFCLIYGHRLPCCPLCYSLPCRVYIRPIIKKLSLRLMLLITSIILEKQLIKISLNFPYYHNSQFFIFSSSNVVSRVK